MFSKPILVLSGVRGDTRRYRIFHLYEQLMLAGLPVSLSHITSPDLLEKVKDAHVIILHRAPYDPKIDRLVRIVNENHGLLILDIDDLIFATQAFKWIDSPDFQDPIRASLYKEDLENNGKTLEASHAILTSTGYLAEIVRQSGKSVWVHRNGFSMEMLSRSVCVPLKDKSSRTKVVIGYASGSPTHNKDFGMVRPALIRIMQQYPQVELCIIGPLALGTEWGDLSSRIQHLRLVPWRQLPEILATFDINLAPLVADNPFSQSKSEIKWMEAGLVRVPTIASPAEAFKFAINEGENGYLAHSEMDWFEKLEHLINHPADRIGIGAKAYQDVNLNYHPVVRASQLIHSLNQIHQLRYGKPLVEKSFSQSELMAKAERIPWLSSTVEKHPNLVEMAWYNLNQHGMLKLVRQVWAYIRRGLSSVIPYKSATNH